MSQAKVITEDTISGLESGFERFIRDHYHEFCPWVGRFKLEPQAKPILFKAQQEFPSAFQTRVYRLYDRKGNPTKACMKFVYGREGLVTWTKESMEIVETNGNGSH